MPLNHVHIAVTVFDLKEEEVLHTAELHSDTIESMKFVD